MALLEVERVWHGRDNTIDLILKADGSAVDLSGTTRVDLVLGATFISATGASTQMITWAAAGYDTGEVRIALGAATHISPGRYEGTLIVYDAASTRGIVWGDEVPIQLLGNPTT